ncbi:dephospho-CoA kinase [Limosilactobacillus avium]|uniref:dephospho-CoA kinase n=1 Tax=Limosilactobacillus avium TaxID=2991831 RepID=UPI0024BB4578|nr:dephospho-CoA kinase [Limosilactobacillus avium]
MTKVVGLTGGIASGKSTVSQMLSQVGLPIVDADQVAHRLQQPGQLGLSELVGQFGREILTADGHLNRGALGKMAFSDAGVRHQLNAIMQPLIRETIMDQLAAFKKQDIPFVILDAPLLFEQGYDQECDLIVVVTVSHDCQVQRLMSRNGYTRAVAEQRIAAQWPLAKKSRQADVVINNDGSLDELRRQVAKLVDYLGAK